MNKSKLSCMIRQSLCLGIGLLFLSQPTWAVDPACENPTEANPTLIYDATSGIRLCSPVLDIMGESLVAGELTNCTVLLDNTPFVTVPMGPGDLVVITAPTTGAKIRKLEAYCSGPGGNGPHGPIYDAQVRREKPGKPIVK